jgi:MtN3 and saliva related transmembrane protein
MTPQIMIEAVGAGAAVCSTTSFLPQLVKLAREKTAEAVSTRMFILTVAAFALWSLYGLMLHSWPLLISNLISLGLSAAILLLKLRYRDRDEARVAPDPG